MPPDGEGSVGEPPPQAMTGSKRESWHKHSAHVLPGASRMQLATPCIRAS